ncbi:MAG: MATE family efflux transporter [Provencibacterium sp.]|jgi:putative MATE family efflux protein|nr:MATE family efflux transporter [Provencibacterium sp.]
MQLFVRDRHFYNQLMRIAIPIALQNLITVMVSMMDTLMIGQLGEVQLSATSIANQLWFLLMIICFGISGGANVLIAQYWGKGDVQVIRRVQAMTYKIALGVSLIFLFISLAFPEAFLSVFTTDAEVIAYGAQYLRIIGFSYPLYALANVTIMMLRSVGTVNISVVMYLVSLVVNTVLNYALIFGHFGAPALGIQGGAAATAIARLFEFGIATGFLLWKEDKLHFRLKDLLPSNRELYKKYISLSIPVIGNELTWGLGASLVGVVIGRMGTNFVAANSIFSVLNQFVSVLIFGIGNAALTLVGNTIGAGEYEKAKQRSVTLYALALIIGIFSGALTLALGPLLRSFYHNLSAETVEIYNSLVLVGALVIVFIALANVGMVGILRAGGDAKFVFFADVAFLWLIAVPLGFITGLWLHWPAPVVYLFLKSDEFLKVICSTVRILRFRWLRDVTL